ncbi:PhzF family phenazine biosynthesis protein [Burkholderia sp. WAC0059]|uniref:PhzF family phenazine biosynthesis protein n=1 Tax=Burkholderia sp. WAC0059 TaxID=2066022 RepID=UPI000C7EA766|nr:PhzF family phenazine biosynthesis protein [Burkholderia sp. WAC0059]PLZ01531.1 PhzF family phenazine biosynthesis protein [Burkholderia sp. WAC0059]
MSVRTVRFKQIDVFTQVPFRGNPLAVVFDADALDSDEMQTIARWTQLSETTFLVAPTDPQADYRVRIFTPAGELPFAGHPTLGTAHALLDSGYRPKTPGRLVQQCGVGLVELAGREDSTWAFAAPPARVAPLPAERHDALCAALGTSALDPGAPPCAVDNGAPWLVVRLASAADCLALDPDLPALARIAHEAGTHGLAAYGPHPADGPATFEVRCLMAGPMFGQGEDPVTGSANAAIANLLTHQNRRPGPRYTARQGTVLGRDGRIVVDYDDAAGRTWIGGASVTVVDGTFRLPDRLQS